jgi:polar amino acid transport system substrate-binding protein
MKRGMSRQWQFFSIILPSLVIATALVLVGIGLLRRGPAAAVWESMLASSHAEPASISRLKIGVAHLRPTDAPGDRIYVEEGFETDLANALGERLKVPVDIVLVRTAEQQQALSEGRIDAVIARVPSDDALHRTARVLQTGYASGISPVVRSDRPPQGWGDLAGKVVCLTETNERGQKLVRSVGAEVHLVHAPAQALMLLRTGECGAALHDREVLNLLFKKRFWQKFSATLPPVEPTSLVVAVARDRDALARRISRALADVGSAPEWQKRRERWVELVSFEVYRDQVVGDCH